MLKICILIINILLVNACTVKNNSVKRNSFIPINKEENSDFQSSVFAIVKYSYNKLGDDILQGGICGTAFSVNDSTILTANHIMDSIFFPNKRYSFVQLFLLKRGTKTIIEFTKEDIKILPEIDIAVIKCKNKFKNTIVLSEQDVKINDSVFSYGHVANMNPVTAAHWGNKLILDNYSLDEYKSDNVGTVVLARKITVRSLDVNVSDKMFYKTSFIGNVGMSGGPLFSNNKLIGLMSFGLPVDKIIKTEVFAISVNEIIKSIK